MLDLVDDAAGSFNPLAAVVNWGASLDGFENCSSRGFAGFDVVHDMGGSELDVEEATIVKAGGVSVAIDDAGAAEVVFDGDSVAAVPVKEVEFNVFAVFVIADFAFATVAFESRGLVSFGLRLCCGHLLRRVTKGQAKRTCTGGRVKYSWQMRDGV
jgi:hypothetical protein